MNNIVQEAINLIEANKISTTEVADVLGKTGQIPNVRALNKGKFCAECGTKKPEGAPLYRCDKCGWEPEDPTKPPKFCPQCGDPFGSNDIV